MNVEQFSPYIVHDFKNVKGFFKDYRFLSNFHECEIWCDGLLFKSTEAAYQAQKTKERNEQKLFTTMTPKEAKVAGGKVTLREDWSKVKDTIMFELNYQKFSSFALKKLLKGTESMYLEETNWWHDTYWGASYSELNPQLMVGQNQLGNILMMIRAII